MNSMQTVYVVMANSIGLVMQNASTNQREGQISANASTAVCMALIVKKGAGN